MGSFYLLVHRSPERADLEEQRHHPGQIGPVPSESTFRTRRLSIVLVARAQSFHSTGLAKLRRKRSSGLLLHHPTAAFEASRFPQPDQRLHQRGLNHPA